MELACATVPPKRRRIGGPESLEAIVKRELQRKRTGQTEKRLTALRNAISLLFEQIAHRFDARADVTGRWFVGRDRETQMLKHFLSGVYDKARAKHAGSSEEHGKSILVHGPVGCGKTVAVQQTIEEAKFAAASQGVNLIVVNVVAGIHDPGEITLRLGSAMEESAARPNIIRANDLRNVTKARKAIENVATESVASLPSTHPLRHPIVLCIDELDRLLEEQAGRAGRNWFMWLLSILPRLKKVYFIGILNRLDALCNTAPETKQDAETDETVVVRRLQAIQSRLNSNKIFFAAYGSENLLEVLQARERGSEELAADGIVFGDVCTTGLTRRELLKDILVTVVNIYKGDCRRVLRGVYQAYLMAGQRLMEWRLPEGEGRVAALTAGLKALVDGGELRLTEKDVREAHHLLTGDLDKEELPFTRREVAALAAAFMEQRRVSMDAWDPVRIAQVSQRLESLLRQLDLRRDQGIFGVHFEDTDDYEGADEGLANDVIQGLIRKGIFRVHTTTHIILPGGQAIMDKARREHGAMITLKLVLSKIQEDQKLAALRTVREFLDRWEAIGDHQQEEDGAFEWNEDEEMAPDGPDNDMSPPAV